MQADPTFDVGFTGVDGYPSIASCVDALALKRGAPARPGSDRKVPFVSQDNYSNFKYLLHMPGAATGSYSRNLQYLWSHGAIVLLWNHTATEWYYRHLEDGVNCVVVDAATLKERVEALERDAAAQARLRAGAAALHRAQLAPAALVARWRAVFDALNARQDAAPPKIDNSTACSCDQGIGYAACSQCRVTRLSSAQLTQHLGVTHRPRDAPLGVARLGGFQPPPPVGLGVLAARVLATTTLAEARAVVAAYAR